LSKLPTDVTGKETIKALKKIGWEILRIGKHHQLYNDKYPDRIISIPCHSSPLKKGLLHNVLKLAELDVDEFRALL
jgi:predicted RNA binding protein YcfA (HicA-like mRNA interferase family)